MSKEAREDWPLGTRKRLTPRDLPRFAGDTLFDALARTICNADCLPRKELFESWEFAKRVSRRAKGGPVVDLACGHGVVAWMMLLLDRSTTSATCIDPRLPPSAARLAEALSARFPGAASKITYVEDSLDAAQVTPTTRVLAVHACGALTDRALDLALAARAPFAALPCCHSRRKQDDGGLIGWLPFDLAIDVTRVGRLRDAGYTVWTSSIPEEITPKNRLFLGLPG
jgi:hypothetical protein